VKIAHSEAQYSPVVHSASECANLQVWDGGGVASWWVEQAEGLLLRVRVIPGARTSEIIGVIDERLKIRLAARPVEGQANGELVRVVADWCGVRPSAIEIVRGSTSRSKDLLIHGLAEPPKSPTL
jgi:uncharacterized protein (TIGR00251 family)